MAIEGQHSGHHLKLITEQGPARTRLERTLREAQSLSKALGELSLALTGDKYQEAPTQRAVRGPDGLIPQIDATARDIETEIANMRQLIDHIRRLI
jgi:aspartate aminotransferase-like enzyme